MADYTLTNGHGTDIRENADEHQAFVDLSLSTLTEAEELQAGDAMVLQRSTNTPQKVTMANLLGSPIALNTSYVY